jgi:hypothetical protein
MDYLKWARAQWDRVGAVMAVVGGLLALLFGWIGVSGSAYPAAQLPYVVSGGLLGIFLLGVGGTLWLSADIRDEWRKLDRIEEALRASPAPSAAVATPAAAAAPAAVAAPPASANGRTKVPVR